LDDDVKKIIKKTLKKWEGETINQNKLSELKEIIHKKTGKYKFLPYTNLKKWIKEVKSEMKEKDKKTTKKKVETKTKKKPTATKGKEKVKVVKEKKAKEENVAPKAVISPFQDRVLFQNLSYEISSMRRALERISKQLNDLEGTLKEINEKE
jgi:glutamate synthase domain-containing protein 2